MTDTKFKYFITICVIFLFQATQEIQAQSAEEQQNILDKINFQCLKLAKESAEQDVKKTINNRKFSVCDELKKSCEENYDNEFCRENREWLLYSYVARNVCKEGHTSFVDCREITKKCMVGSSKIADKECQDALKRHLQVGKQN